MKMLLPSRKLTYPTWGKGKSSSNLPYQGDMLIPWRVCHLTWWVGSISSNWLSPSPRTWPEELRPLGIIRCRPRRFAPLILGFFRNRTWGPLKLTVRTWKMMFGRFNFLLGWSFFKGYVTQKGGSFLLWEKNFYQCNVNVCGKQISNPKRSKKGINFYGLTSEWTLKPLMLQSLLQVVLEWVFGYLNT